MKEIKDGWSTRCLGIGATAFIAMASRAGGRHVIIFETKKDLKIVHIRGRAQYEEGEIEVGCSSGRRGRGESAELGLPVPPPS